MKPQKNLLVRQRYNYFLPHPPNPQPVFCLLSGIIRPSVSSLSFDVNLVCKLRLAALHFTS